MGYSTFNTHLIIAHFPDNIKYFYLNMQMQFFALTHYYDVIIYYTV